MSARDWNAASYDRVSGPQFAWALEQLGRLALREDEVVLDACCGSGPVTARLVDLVPRGRAYAIDVAPSMVEHGRATLGGRATVLCQDLVALSLPEPVDAVFSNATFHWIDDKDALFRACTARCGRAARSSRSAAAAGNIDRFRAIAEEVAQSEEFARWFVAWQGPWNYADAPDTARRLEEAGFTEVRTSLEPRSVTPADGRAFAETVCLVRHLDRLPAERRPAFTDRVLARAGEPLVLEYVRLNIVARRP